MGTLGGAELGSAAAALDGWSVEPGDAAITVEARLTSHDAGGVTERDLNLARFMDEIASGLTRPV